MPAFSSSSLDEICHVHGHLRDFRRVELFDITKITNITLREEVDGHTLTTETSGTTDTVDVVLSIRGQVKVDDQRNLLHVDTTSEQIGGDQDTRGTGTELAHDNVTLPLVHVSVHARNGEVALLHLLLKPVDLAASVAVNNRLGDGQGLVQIAQSLQLPLFPIDSNVKLLDTFEGQLVLLDKDANGFAHKALRHLQHVQRHGSREKTNLDGFGKELKNVVNLVLEPTRKHLVGLVQKELTNVVQSQGTTVDHVGNATGRSDHDLHTLLEGTNVVTDGGTTDTCVDLNVHVVAEGQDDLLNLLRQLAGGSQDEGLTVIELGVDLGETANGKGSGFSLS